jgi:hypothetical protein
LKSPGLFGEKVNQATFQLSKIDLTIQLLLRWFPMEEKPQLFSSCMTKIMV